MNDGHFELIENVLLNSSRALESTMDCFCPTFGDNEMSERNTTLHFEHSLLLSGFHVFTEVALSNTTGSNDEGMKHLDLLAIHSTDNLVVSVERKRLFDGAQAQKMVNDYLRMKDYCLTKKFMNYPYDSYFYYGVLLATGWNDKITSWWQGRCHSKKPINSFSTSCDSLGSILDMKSSRTSSFLLDHYHYEWKSKHKLLYSILDFGERVPS